MSAIDPKWPRLSSNGSIEYDSASGASVATTGQNVKMEYRWAAGHDERLPAMAVELVNRPVAVLLTGGGLWATISAKAATATIPIVFTTASDPVELGYVASLNRPGGNVTGVIAPSRGCEFGLKNGYTSGIISSTDPNPVFEVNCAWKLFGVGCVHGSPCGARAPGRTRRQTTAGQ